MVEENQDQAAAQAGNAQKRERELSTIEFSYSDLDSAIEIARMVHDKAGTSCEVIQLASWLGQSAAGGTFRSRLSAARLFGLIETERGGVASLTALGRNILDAGKEHDSRVMAFLNVELYREMYENFKGHSLPPAPALERQMVGFGVASKQADRARQVFTKSADQAHFIDQQTGRFVKPGMATRQDDPSPNDQRDKGGGGGKPPLDPTLQGLVDRLPRGGAAKWPLADRVKWHRALVSVSDIVYGDEEGELIIAVKAPTKMSAENGEGLPSQPASALDTAV